MTDLDEALLGEEKLSETHRDILARILRIVRHLGEERCHATIELDYKCCHVGRLEPTRSGPSRIEVCLNHDTEDGTVGIVAGDGVRFWVPEDVNLPQEASVPEMVQSTVDAIVYGRLKETICVRAGVAYRWVSELPTELGCIKIDRTNVPRQVRTLFKKGTKKTIVYPSYLD